MVTVGIAVAIVCIMVLFTGNYVESIYDDYLRDKALLIAQKHLEKDELDAKGYQSILEKNNRLLPQANELVINADDKNGRILLNKYLSVDERVILTRDKVVNFSFEDMEGAAIYYPDNEGNFFVFVMADNGYGRDIMRHIIMLSVLLIIVSCMLIFVLSHFYSGWILRPLKTILSEIKRIRGNKLNVRLPRAENNDELGELTTTLNSMLDRVEEAFVGEKSFVSNASHELNNPMTAIHGECEIALMKERTSEEYQKSLNIILAESDRVVKLIKSLLFLSHNDGSLQATDERVNLSSLLNSVAMEYKNISIRKSPEFVATEVAGGEFLLRTAFSNIVGNAHKYSEGKPVIIDCRIENDMAIVSVKDSGIGIPKEDIAHIFQPFYRADNTRGFIGHGIGLSLAYKIIRAYGGNIIVDSIVGKYTCFQVYLCIA